MRWVLVSAVITVGLGATSPRLTIAGRVTGMSGRHAVLVALWQSEGFLSEPTQSLRIYAGEPMVFHFEVTPGRWALSAFEDVNGNGVLDMGLFGPTEPNGFFKAFSGWHKPQFDEVAFDVDGGVSGVDIALK